MFMFNETVIRCLKYHYGPYIHLIQSGVSELSTTLKSRIERRMNKLTQNLDRLPLYRGEF